MGENKPWIGLNVDKLQPEIKLNLPIGMSLVNFCKEHWQPYNTIECPYCTITQQAERIAELENESTRYTLAYDYLKRENEELKAELKQLAEFCLNNPIFQYSEYWDNICDEAIALARKVVGER